MGIFDPKVDANISPEQQVSGGPSNVQVGANILGTALGIFGKAIDNRADAIKAPTAAQVKDATETAQIAGLSKGLAKVTALRSQGKSREADQLEMQLKANAARDNVDFNNPAVKATIEAGTGDSAENFGFTTDQIQARKMMETPEFSTQYAAVRANNPDLTNDQAVELSLSNMMDKASNEMRVQDQNLAWVDGQNGKREAWNKSVQTSISEGTALISSLAQSDQILSGKDFRVLSSGWQVERQRLVSLLPSDLDAAEREKAMKEITRMDNVVKTLDEQFEGTDVVEARLVEGLTTTLLKSDLGAGQKFLGMSMLKNPENYEQLTGSQEVANQLFGKGDDDGILAATDGKPVGGPEFANLSDPVVNTTIPEGASNINVFDPEVAKQLGELSPTELNERSGKQVSFLGQTKANNQDPASRNDRTGIITQVFTETHAVPAGTGDFMSGEALQQRLGAAMVAEVDDIATYDPRAAGTLAAQAYTAADANGAVISEQLNVLLERNPDVSVVDGRLSMDQGALTRMGISDQAQGMLTEAADRYYGGDMAAMFLDNGRKAMAMGSGFRQLRGSSVFQVAATEMADTNALLGNLETATALKTQWQSRAVQYGVEPSVVGSVAEVATAEEPLVEVGADVAAVKGYELVANDADFLAANKRVANDLGISDADLLGAISFETIGTFNPSIQSPNSSATGLIQFLDKTAAALGTSTEALGKMSRAEQMKYVGKYLAPFKGKLKNRGDVYMAIHWPKAVGKDDSYVMYESGSQAYKANSGLDVNGDGTITRGETLVKLNAYFGDKKAKGPAVDTTTPAQPSTPETMSLGGAVQLAGIAADAGQDTQNAALEATTDELRSKSAPQQQATPSADALGGSVAAQQDAAASLKLAQAVLTDGQRQQIRDKGYRPEETRYFATREQAEAALAAGEVESGVLYITGTGNVWRTGD